MANSSRAALRRSVDANWDSARRLLQLVIRLEEVARSLPDTAPAARTELAHIGREMISLSDGLTEAARQSGDHLAEMARGSW